MLVDDDPVVRNEAAEKIIAARNTRNETRVRVFRKPTRSQINENANHYSEILQWHMIFSKDIIITI